MAAIPLILNRAGETQINLYSSVQSTLRTVTSASQRMGLKNVDAVTLSVKSAIPLDIRIGDYMMIYGRRYNVNRMPDVTKLANRLFEYNITLEGVVYDLNRALYSLNIDTTSSTLQDVQADALTGNLNRFASVLIACLNGVFPSRWALGTVPGGTETKTLQFSSDDTCLSVAQRLSDEYDVEFDIVQGESVNTLHFREAGIVFPYTMQYGADKSLYQLSRQNVDSSNIITRLRAQGSTQNITSKYRGYRLLLPGKNKANSYVDDATMIAKYGIWEGAKTYDDIKPERLGSVTSVPVGYPLDFIDSVPVGYPLDFIDSGMNFDLNAKDGEGNTLYLLPGIKAKVNFVSGNLAGFAFDIEKYDHATKRFTIIPITTERGDKYPSDSSAFQIGIGDTYRLTEITLPQAYITDAENRLLDAALEDYQDVSQPKVRYGLNVYEMFLKGATGLRADGNIFLPGDKIPVLDTAIDVDKQIRVQEVTRDLLNPYNYSLTIADTYLINLAANIVKDISALRNDYNRQQVLQRESIITITEIIEDGVIMGVEKQQMLAAIDEIRKDKLSTDAQYNVIYSNVYLDAPNKSALQTQYNAFVSSYNALLTLLNTAIEDDQITEEERDAIEAALNDYAAKLAAYNAQEKTAEKSLTDAMQSTLIQWAADGIISPTEKIAIKQTRQRIVVEKANVLDLAAKYGVSTTAYSDAWTAYDNVLAKYSADLPQNIPVESDFAIAEEAYKTAKINVDAAIAEIEKGITDSLQNVLNIWAADGYISPTEKIAIRQTRTRIADERAVTLADAAKYGISTTTYTNAWTAYDNVLIKYSAATPENIPVEADFQSATTAYSNAYIDISNQIETARKDEISSKQPAGSYVTHEYLAQLIELDSVNNAVRVRKSLYSDKSVSALGLGSGGGGGSDYNRLDQWADYDSSKAGWVLSAYLGYNLHTRVNSLEQGSALTINTTGSGNVVTAVAKSGTVITVTKGITALTANQNITLSGDVTGSGSTAITASIAAATVTGKVLTGYAVGTNATLAATDTILSAFGKVQAQINARPGTVTSVAMTAPTGFSISGSPITSSGTLALAFASGYSLPTTAKQGQWDTAYTNNHTHSNKSVLNAITATQTNNWNYTYNNYASRTYSSVYAYLGATYNSGGNEVPSYFGSGKLRLNMLNAPTNMGLTGWGTWADVLWMSSYTGSDVKGSNALVLSKSEARIAVVRANYDATAWGSSYELYHTGNFTPANYVPTSRTVTAGNGLTGGGALSGNITLALATPSTLTAATTNAVTASSHTHAITTTSAGAASTIVQTNESGGTTFTGTVTIPSLSNTEMYLRHVSGGGTVLSALTDIHFRPLGDQNTTNNMVLLGASGNVGIGNNAPGYKLHVNGNVYANGNISATGSINALATSDRRLKQSVRNIESALDTIMKLRPVMYYWTLEAHELNPFLTERQDYGLIAQEVEEVLPDIVGTMYDGDWKGLDDKKIIPFLIGAIKEMKRDYDSRIAELESKLTKN